MKVLRTVGGTLQERCVPRRITWNWFHNRGPKGRR